MFARTKSRLFPEEVELKIKQIISKTESSTKVTKDSKKLDQTGPELVPHILNYLHNEISDIYHLIERSTRVTEETTIEKTLTLTLDSDTHSFAKNATENQKAHGQRSNFVAGDAKVSSNKQRRIRPEQITSKNNYQRNKGQQQFSKGRNDQAQGAFQTQLPPDLFDESAFPSLGSAVVVVPEVKKRVKPNSMSKCAPPHPGFTLQNALNVEISPTRSNNAAFTSAPIKEKDFSQGSFKEEREQLKALQEESKLNNNKKATPIQTSPVKSSSESSNSSFVIPDRDKVTEIEKLNILITAYVNCINGNYVPNIATEFYFLCQLLTFKFPATSSNTTEIATEMTLFNSVHNCVYFSVTVLESCPHLLQLLKPSGLRMLLDMTHLGRFSARFIDLLKGLVVEKSKTAPSNPFNNAETVEDAAYREEIDSRDNFASEKSFAAYRRQRDAFKKILKDWEDHSHQPDWLYASSFKNEVRNICVDNAFHMAKLFLSELEARCMLDEIADDVEDELLSKFEGAKLRKLQKRMKSSLTAYEDPNANIVFHYFEAFFRDFLQCNNSVSLYRHLLDMLYTKVTELNDFTAASNLTESATDNSAFKKDKLFQRIKELRLYAKFLGFLYFLPYQTHDEIPPSNIAHELKTIRKDERYVATIRKILLNATENKQLTLVIPWIVEYLSNMDKLAPLLRQYQEIFQDLVQIYRHVLPQIKNANAALLLKINLGRLFGNFSQRVFFTDFPLANYANLGEHARIKKLGLDDSFLVDEKLMHLCCPNIASSENLLRNYFQGKVKEPRKIKPYAVEDKIPNFGFAMEISHLQRQLEANFFHLNPTLKEVVEFATERATAKVKESFLILYLPKIKDSVLLKVDYKNIAGGKAHAQKEITNAVGLFHKEIWDKTPEYVKKQCDDVCLQLITMATSVSTSTAIAETAAKIASRAATYKVLQFIQTYTTNESLRAELKDGVKAYGKQFNSSTESTNNFTSASTKTETEAEMNYSIIKILENLREFSSNLLNREIPCQNCDDILNAIAYCKITNHDDYLTKSLKFMVADWFVTLIVFKPDDVTSNFYAKFFNFYEQFDAKPANLINLICARNLELLKKSPGKVASWRKMEFAVIYLLQKGWLSRKELEAQCVAVLKIKFPQNLLTYFANFLSNVVENEKRSGKFCDNDFLEILDWLAWFCQEPEV